MLGVFLSSYSLSPLIVVLHLFRPRYYDKCRAGVTPTGWRGFGAVRGIWRLALG